MNTHGKKRKIHQGIENLKRSDRRQEKSLAKQAHQVKPDKILVKELNTKLFDEYLALNENCLKEICGKIGIFQMRRCPSALSSNFQAVACVHEQMTTMDSYQKRTKKAYLLEAPLVASLCYLTSRTSPFSCLHSTR